jgi:hypothetical protein
LNPFAVIISIIFRRFAMEERGLRVFEKEEAF